MPAGLCFFFLFGANITEDAKADFVTFPTLTVTRILLVSKLLCFMEVRKILLRPKALSPQNIAGTIFVSGTALAAVCCGRLD